MSTPTKSVVSPTQCKICNKEFKSLRSLSIHVGHMHTIDIPDYYKAYIDSNTPVCLTCGATTGLRSITRGYYDFCSTACNNKNSEKNAQRTVSRLNTLKNDPTIMQKSLAKKTETLRQNPGILIDAAKKFKQTHEDNPHIRKNSIKKFKETIKANPEIIIDRSIKIKEIYLNSPHIKEQANKRHKETLASNPNIMRNIVEKRKQTLEANPEILINSGKKISAAFNLPGVKAERSKKTSVALREHYGKLKHNSSTTRCNIYLVRHSSLNIVKIGIALNLDIRLYKLQRHFGPVEIIKAIETTYDKALSLEIEMHNHFKEQCRVQPSGSGRTEWYSDVITEEALQMLQEAIP